MKSIKQFPTLLAGAAAGILNGLFGGGGGMVLVPLLDRGAHIPQEQIFPSSVSIILPISLISLGMHAISAPLPWEQAWPYLIGSAIGGIAAGILGKRIPLKWLHRGLGCLILWGGIRYLC